MQCDKNKKLKCNVKKMSNYRVYFDTFTKRKYQMKIKIYIFFIKIKGKRRRRKKNFTLFSSRLSKAIKPLTLAKNNGVPLHMNQRFHSYYEEYIYI